MKLKGRARTHEQKISKKKNLSVSQRVSLALCRELREMTSNIVMSRAALLKTLDNMGGHDINQECGYPETHQITLKMYKEMFEREGIATRVVTIFPTECWAVEPFVFETQKLKKDEQTKWEKGWNKLWKDLHLYKWLSQLDEISGIGHYGVLFLGFDDAKELNRRVQGISERGRSTGKANPKKLLFVTPLDESNAKIKSWENDRASPRYGLPKMYQLRFQDPDASSEQQSTDSRWVDVHWSRVIHVPTDGCSTSKVFGPPRQRTVFNRLIDCRKILGSSGEMFWKGGFPGISFETPGEAISAGHEVVLSDEDKTKLKEEIEKYMTGLKRYLSLVGFTAKQMQVNIADPDVHLQVQMQAICIAIGVPIRIFMGSEEGKLASTQDTVNWNKKIKKRQNTYITPVILREFVDRLMAVGVLPELEEYFVEWPDVYSMSDKDKADNAQKIVRAIAEYVTSEAKTLIPPMQFLSMILSFSPDEAEEIMDAAEEYIKEQIKKGRMLDPKEEIKLQKEERKAGMDAMKMKAQSPMAQGFRGGQNQPKRTKATNKK